MQWPSVCLTESLRLTGTHMSHVQLPQANEEHFRSSALYSDVTGNLYDDDDNDETLAKLRNYS